MRKNCSYPNCYKCGSPVEAREDQAVVRFEDEEILFQRIPLGVCRGCGERFLNARAARLMESATVLCRKTLGLTPGAIRALRDALSLTREGFAAKLETSAQTVFRWETGRSRPSPSARKRIEALRKRGGRERKAG